MGDRAKVASAVIKLQSHIRETFIDSSEPGLAQYCVVEIEVSRLGGSGRRLAARAASNCEREHRSHNKHCEAVSMMSSQFKPPL